jgi:EpsI family protein
VPVDDPLGSVYEGADAVRTVCYRRDGQEIVLQIADYARQTRDAEVVSHGNRLYEADRWQLARRAVIRSGSGQGSVEVKQVVLSGRGGEQRTVWRLYRVGGLVTGYGYQAKLLQVWAQVARRPAAAVITLSAAGLGDDGLRLLGEFWRELGAEIAIGAEPGGAELGGAREQG